jgi:lipoate-protein ligase A
MGTELNPNEREQHKSIMVRQSGGDAVYGIGLFGAWAYYLSQATTFQQGVQGFFKGFVWPAILVYELLKFLNKETD